MSEPSHDRDDDTSVLASITRLIERYDEAPEHLRAEPAYRKRICELRALRDELREATR